MINDIDTPLSGAPLKRRVLDDIFRVSIVLVSSAIYALSVVWFLEPANLLSLGLSSFGQVLHRVFLIWDIDIPIGVFSLVLNIPLCIIGIKYVSPRFIFPLSFSLRSNNEDKFLFLLGPYSFHCVTMLSLLADHGTSFCLAALFSSSPSFYQALVTPLLLLALLEVVMFSYCFSA